MRTTVENKQGKEIPIDVGFLIAECEKSLMVSSEHLERYNKQGAGWAVARREIFNALLKALTGKMGLSFLTAMPILEETLAEYYPDGPELIGETEEVQVVEAVEEVHEVEEVEPLEPVQANKVFAKGAGFDNVVTASATNKGRPVLSGVSKAPPENKDGPIIVTDNSGQLIRIDEIRILEVYFEMYLNHLSGSPGWRSWSSETMKLGCVTKFWGTLKELISTTGAGVSYAETMRAAVQFSGKHFNTIENSKVE